MHNNINVPMVSSRFFKRVGIGFIIFTAGLLFVVMYMALSRATIIVEPNEKPINADLLVSVREKELRSGDVLGKVGAVSVSREASFPVSGGGEERPAKALGEVTIYNNHIKSQTLVATTRLLSKTGVLFRLQKTVNVSAGGSVKAAIIADKEGKSGEVGPTTFTIPGLAQGLQDKIYAKSAAATFGGIARARELTEKDIKDAVENMKPSLLSEAAAELKKTLNGDSQFMNIVFKDAIKINEASADPGDKVENFKIKLELDVVGVAYSAALQDQAARTLSSMIPSDRKLTSSNILELQPTIEKYDMDDHSANLKVALLGNSVISPDSPVFDKEKLAGMTEDEVKQYLEKYAGIKSAEVKFFPFWVDKVPKLKNHIKIIVK